jgi:pilus assembly protein Flp/PilA
MMKLFKSLIKEEKGQGMVEYALIIALIAIVVMAALSPLGVKIKAVFEKITDKLSS